MPLYFSLDKGCQILPHRMRGCGPFDPGSKQIPFLRRKGLCMSQKKMWEYYEEGLRISRRGHMTQGNQGFPTVLPFLFGQMMIMECKKNENLKDCTCTYDCDKKGMCCECVRYHRQRNEIPGCFFSKASEKTYNRSVNKFIEDHK